jgi:hypothetical protein
MTSPSKTEQTVIKREPGNSELAYIAIAVDYFGKTYRRTPYGILDFLGDVGGFNDAIRLILQFFIGFFSSRAY